MFGFGLVPFRVLNPLVDLELIENSRELARRVLDEDPDLALSKHRRLAAWLDKMGHRSPFWSASG